MKNEMELENKKEEVKIPWQLNVWLIFYFVGILVFLFILFNESINNEISDYLSLLFFAFVFKANYLLVSVSDVIYFDWIDSIARLIIIVFNVCLILFLIKGKKLVLIFLLGSSSLFFLNFIYQEAFDSIDGNLDFNLFLLVLLFLFSIYLEISCLKHPYFNQKKIKN